MPQQQQQTTLPRFRCKSRASRTSNNVLALLVLVSSSIARWMSVTDALFLSPSSSSFTRTVGFSSSLWPTRTVLPSREYFHQHHHHHHQQQQQQQKQKQQRSSLSSSSRVVLQALGLTTEPFHPSFDHADDGNNSNNHVDDDDNDDDIDSSELVVVGKRQCTKLRHRLRAITGFSWTALRATMRATTGISLTALYASTMAATSLFVRNVMNLILRLFPTWLRYFFQPFLVLYYAPLFAIRSYTSPTHRRQQQQQQRAKMATHQELLTDAWNNAIQAAAENSLSRQQGEWPVVPVTADDEGLMIESTVQPLSMNPNNNNDMDIDSIRHHRHHHSSSRPIVDLTEAVEWISGETKPTSSDSSSSSSSPSC